MSARDVIAEVICGKYLSPSEGTYDKADDILRALADHFQSEGRDFVAAALRAAASET